MKTRLCSLKQILVMAAVIFLPFHGQTALCQSAAIIDVDDQACSTLQSCVGKYQLLLPEWQRNFERFGERIDQELPEIGKGLEAFGDKFGKEGESHLRQWLDDLRRKLPQTASDPALPETLWI